MAWYGRATGVLVTLLGTAAASENVVETNRWDLVGAWGGTCTCPDGEVYRVGLHLYDSQCGATSDLACYGGVSGPCSTSNSGGQGVVVTCVGCGDNCPPPAPPASPGAPPSLCYKVRWGNGNQGGIQPVTGMPAAHPLVDGSLNCTEHAGLSAGDPIPESGTFAREVRAAGAARAC